MLVTVTVSTEHGSWSIEVEALDVIAALNNVTEALTKAQALEG